MKAGRQIAQRHQEAPSRRLTQLVTNALLDEDLGNKLFADPASLARAFGLTVEETQAIERLDRRTFERWVAHVRSA